MAAQNIYDDPDFLAGYVTLDRQVHGLDGASEWPTLRSMLPDMHDARVLDLGCGFGWFSRWAVESGAASVLGVDLSTKMLERARVDTASDAIEYLRADLDSFEPRADSWDCVFSSLTLHYVRDLDRLMSATAEALRPGGSLVFSVEHPILSAPTMQAFDTSSNGDRIWPLDNYLVEGERVTDWFVEGVVKQHRTVATYVNTVIDAGLTLNQIVEFSTSDDQHRPWFLLVQAMKPA